MNDSLSKELFLKKRFICLCKFSMKTSLYCFKLALQDSFNKLYCNMPFYLVLIYSHWMNCRLINCQVTINDTSLLVVVGIMKHFFDTLSTSLAQKIFFLNIQSGEKMSFQFRAYGITIMD